MAMRNQDRDISFVSLFLFLSVFICVHLWFLPPVVAAQDEPTQEVAVNLTEGRVLICAATDAIIVSTISGQGEPGSRPPVVLSLSALRAGVMMGAVEWVQPDSKDKPVRLDSELPGIIAAALNTSGVTKYANAATDIETIGGAAPESVAA